MILQTLQKNLESIYRIHPPYPIEQFVINSVEIQKLLPTETDPKPSVFLQEEGSHLYIAVYIGEALLTRMEWMNLHPVTLEDFCSVVEEVSHFLYVSWSAENQKSVSLLDVEMQGEIDKYLLALQYFSQTQDLFSKMFHQVSFSSDLTKDLRERYEKANQLGKKWIRFLGADRSPQISFHKNLSFLRRFYRWNSFKRVSKAIQL